MNQCNLRGPAQSLWVKHGKNLEAEEPGQDPGEVLVRWGRRRDGWLQEAVNVEELAVTQLHEDVLQQGPSLLFTPGRVLYWP